MARYCFYCGRSLNAGEKCNCRTAGSRRADGDFSDKTGTADPRQKRDRSGGSQSQNKPPRSSGAFRRFVNAFNPFFQETETQGTAAQPKRKRARKAKPVRKPFNPQDFLLSIRRFAQYLTRPVDSIRGAVHTANRLHILLTLLIRGVAGGFFLVLFSKIPLVRSLLSLSLANVATDSGTINDLFVFFQGLGIFIVAPLLLTLLYHLSLRFLYRSTKPYFSLLAGFMPSNLYFSIFLLAGILTMSSSILSALMLILAGLAVAGAAQYLALVEISGFDQNRCFILMAFVTLIYMSLISLLMNLSLPFLKMLIDQAIVF
ncbi:MAG: hypothetical protein ACOX1A_08410 [Saccharofermentanales bacterium]|jgi:hypothetical protein